MKDYARLHVSPAALQQMTPEQFASLRDLTKPGSWDTAASATVLADFSTIFFMPLDDSGVTMIQIGIEPDGYTHS